MSEKAIRIENEKLQEILKKGKSGTFKTKKSNGTIIISNRMDAKLFEIKFLRFTDDSTSSLNASLVNSHSKADLLSPPENPNRRPTRINADRSLSRMKARDRSLVGRGH